jgi:hypothetical protein
MSWPGLSHGCPVEFFWTRRTALILLGSNRLATVRTRKGDSAVRHQNSVFHSITKHIPWHAFARLVEEHGADTRVTPRDCAGTMTLLSFKPEHASRTAKSIQSQRLVASAACEPRLRDSPIKGQCGGARARADAAIDVIEWPGGFYRRNIGWRAFARDPVQLDRITPGSPHFSDQCRP